MNKFILRTIVCQLSAIAVMFVFITPLAIASGGGNGSGGGGSGGGGGTDINQEMMYERGQKLFNKLVVCDTCPYAGLDLETDSVKEVWPDIKAAIKRKGVIGKDLKRYQRTSLKRFIKQRYKLR